MALSARASSKEGSAREIALTRTFLKNMIILEDLYYLAESGEVREGAAAAIPEAHEKATSVEGRAALQWWARLFAKSMRLLRTYRDGLVQGEETSETDLESVVTSSSEMLEGLQRELL